MNTVHLRMLAVQKALDYLSAQDYKAATPALGYFLFWVLGEYGQETEEVSMVSIMEALGHCLLTNQGTQQKKKKKMGMLSTFSVAKKRS